MIDELSDIFMEAYEDNWNGEGTKCVTHETYKKALEFIVSLPKQLSKAKISADSDGEISIEWYKNVNRVFSVSINDIGKLSFACIYDEVSISGTDSFKEKISDFLIFIIEKFIKE